MKHPTYGREFLLLFEKDVRRKCLREIPSSAQKHLIFFFCLYFIEVGLGLHLAYFALKREWFCLLPAIICLFFALRDLYMQMRVPVRTLYHKRRLEAAARRSETAVQALNKKSPIEQYRVPANVSDAVRLRVKLRERTLPEDLKHEATIIIQAHDEMAEAEQALAELEGTKAKTATKTLPTT